MPHEKPHEKRITALALAALAAYFWFSVVHVPPENLVGRAAAPWTDGVEYLDGGVVLARTGRHGIHVAGEIHPSRYPFGFSAVLAAFVSSGVDPAWAPHRANQLGGLLLLACAVAFWWRRIGPCASVVAGWLLATLPAFVILSRSPLSEIWGTLAAVLGIWCLYGFAGGGSRGGGMAGAALLAVSVWFRTSNVLLAPFAAVALLARHGWRPWQDDENRQSKGGLGDLLWLGAAGCVAMVPLWIQNWRSLGRPLSSGYGHWAPYWNAERAFDLRFVAKNSEYYLQEFLQNESVFTTADLYGHGSYVGPAFVLLAAASFWTLRHRRLAWFGAAAAVFVGAMATYFFSDARLLFPLFVLAAPLAAAGVGSVWRRRRHWSRDVGFAARVARSVMTVLLVAALVGWPGPGGVAETVRWVRSQAAEPSPAFVLARQLGRLHDPAPRLVLSDVPAPYVHALLENGVWAAPLADDHLFRFSPDVFVFGQDERRRLMQRALAEGRSIWAMSHRVGVRDALADLPPPDGYVWEVVTEDSRLEAPRSGIARLVETERD